MEVKFTILLLDKYIDIKMEIPDKDIKEYCDLEGGDLVIDEDVADCMIDVLNESIRDTEIESIDFPGHKIKRSKPNSINKNKTLPINEREPIDFQENDHSQLFWKPKYNLKRV